MYIYIYIYIRIYIYTVLYNIDLLSSLFSLFSLLSFLSPLFSLPSSLLSLLSPLSSLLSSFFPSYLKGDNGGGRVPPDHSRPILHADNIPRKVNLTYMYMYVYQRFFRGGESNREIVSCRAVHAYVHARGAWSSEISAKSGKSLFLFSLSGRRLCPSPL